jgi:hypothetical protein
LFYTNEYILGTATTSAYISGAMFESSRKMRLLSPASGEIIGSSTKLLINSVTPRNIGFCDVEGSSQIGVNKEQVDDVQMDASGITKLWAYDY